MAYVRVDTGLTATRGANPTNGPLSVMRSGQRNLIPMKRSDLRRSPPSFAPMGLNSLREYVPYAYNIPSLGAGQNPNGCACGGSCRKCSSGLGRLGDITLPIIGDVSWTTIGIAALLAWFAAKWTAGAGSDAFERRRARATSRRTKIGRARAALRTAKSEPGFLF